MAAGFAVFAGFSMVILNDVLEIGHPDFWMGQYFYVRVSGHGFFLYIVEI